MRHLSSIPTRFVFGACCLLLAPACRPLDPEDTSDAVRGNTLRVGSLTAHPDGPDRAATRRIAAHFAARAQIVHDDPHSLFAMLEDVALHPVVGRLRAAAPFAATLVDLPHVRRWRLFRRHYRISP